MQILFWGFAAIRPLWIYPKGWIHMRQICCRNVCNCSIDLNGACRNPHAWCQNNPIQITGTDFLLQNFLQQICHVWLSANASQQTICSNTMSLYNIVKGVIRSVTCKRDIFGGNIKKKSNLVRHFSGMQMAQNPYRFSVSKINLCGVYCVSAQTSHIYK